MADEPMTPVSGRPAHDSCGAKTRSGGSCGRPAGWGTEHVGIGRCKLHGGASPNHNKAAQVEQARRDVALFGGRRDIHPADALLELVQWTAGEVDYWRQRVRQLEEDDLTWGVVRVKEGGEDHGTTREARPHVAYAMYTDAAKRLESHSVAALRAGIEERQVRLAESSGQLLASVVQSILSRLDLSTVQQELVATVVPEEFRRVAELQATSTPAPEGGAA